MDPLTSSTLGIAALALGLALGAYFTYWTMRGRRTEWEERLRAESQVEVTRQTERVNALTESNLRLQSECAKQEAKIDELRTHLGEVRTQNSQLAERAARIQGLEASLTQASEDFQRLQEAMSATRERLGAAESSLADREQRIEQLSTDLTESERRCEDLALSKEELSTRLASLSKELEGERAQNEEKLALLLQAKEHMSNEFKVLASEILKEQSKEFAESNQERLNVLLGPFQTKLSEFQSNVTEAGKERASLAQQVAKLVELNQQLSADAKNLTIALRGESKTRGTWGELILERVLESSGLRQGEEYMVQESHLGDGGARLQPDVVVHLPENRDLVIDSKVALIDYEEYVNAETDEVRELALKRHVGALRSHIRELSEKKYQSLYGLASLDCVVMFVPVEPAFMLGIANDRELWQDAWKRNVLLVSPSTLLFVLRTVAHLWRQEQQARNVREIASRGAELYDKLAGFVQELQQVGTRLEQARASYDGAMKKLSSGKGNVIRQAEMLKDLGVKPSKTLPPDLIEGDAHPDLPSAASGAT